MSIKYVHTNITAEDWKALSEFYIKVFNCTPVYTKRDMKGNWLEKGTGVVNAHLKGIHLQLPGHEDNGPTLEIFSYSENSDSEIKYANTKGYGHIAFHVSDIKEVLKKALQHGAKKLGEISEKKIKNSGTLRFIYIRDPENNIIELQNRSFL